MDGYAAANSRRTHPCGTTHTAETIRDLSKRAYEYSMQVLRMVY